MEPPERPPLDCPDCGGKMRLRAAPAAWGAKNPWAYICEHAGCFGAMTAHPDGSPMGTPAPREVRRARRHCHSVFDPLWQTAEAMYAIKEQDERHRLSAIKRIRRSARNRAYRFIAEKLGMEPDECHISMITDLETLRQFYREARLTRPEEIRAWAKKQCPPPDPAP